jgi:hypothetical protein
MALQMSRPQTIESKRRETPITIARRLFIIEHREELL